MFFEYDDEDRGLYEEGHWEWSDEFNELTFIRDANIEEEPELIKNVIISGPIKFNDDMDDKEEVRFQKSIQRKVLENDVITLQDVKDVALFAAPKSILKPSLIKAFHLPVTDRFLRSLILYFHYFFQVKEEMVRRVQEKQTKIETPKTIQIEEKYSVDLEDLRLLIAVSYSSIIQGACGFEKYHHLRYSDKNDSAFFEIFLAVSIHIIYLALGRVHFDHIELETHRLFKSHIFNIAKHNPRLNVDESKKPSLIHQIKQTKNKACNTLNRTEKNNKMKLLVHSPLFDEILRKRKMEFQLIGLGVAEYSCLNSRLRYLENALIAPENELQYLELSLGIIGLPRKRFDIMLRYIKFINDESKASVSARPSAAKSSSSTSRHRSCILLTKVYPNISIPESSDIGYFQTSSFQLRNSKFDMSTKQQQQKWIKYLKHRRNHLTTSSQQIGSKYDMSSTQHQQRK